MSKTPYELRYELLMMAQSIITENLMNERIRLENDWNVKRDLVVEAASRGVAAAVPPFPDIAKLDVNQVIEMAKTLNNFVSNTGE
jgi:hypothetical protein